MQKREQYAVSEIIGMILVLGIITSSVTFILVYYSPIIDNQKADMTLTSVLNQFRILNGIVQDLVSQGKNCSRVYTFVTDRGSVNVDSKGDRFIIYYSLGTAPDFDVYNLDDGDDRTFNLAFQDAPTVVNVDYLNGSVRYNLQDLSEPSLIVAPYPIAGHVRIDINWTADLNPPKSHIWLFDAGSITFQISSSSGTQEIVAENGALLRVYSSGNSWLPEPPVVFNQSNHFVLNFIQIQGATGGGGPGTYKINLRVENRTLRENNQPVPWVRMQVFGSYADTWLQYFNSSYGFTNYPNADATIQLQFSPLLFTLVHSECNAIVGGIS
jgi:hypothetical protein